MPARLVNRLAVRVLKTSAGPTTQSTSAPSLTAVGLPSAPSRAPAVVLTQVAVMPHFGESGSGQPPKCP